MKSPLSVKYLYKYCDPQLLKFESAYELPVLKGVIGQERALESIDFGLELESTGFNIFLLGEKGTGKTSTIKAILEGKAKTEPVPDDWCYVYNFKDPDTPTSLSLEHGRGVQFQKDMENLVKTLQTEIPKEFESKEYDEQKKEITEEFSKKQHDLIDRFNKEAKSKGFVVNKTIGGFIIVPAKESGDILPEKEFDALDQNTKKQIEETGKSLYEKLGDIMKTIRKGEKYISDLIARLEKETALSVIEPLIEEMKVKYKGKEKIKSYLEDVEKDVIENIQAFRKEEEAAASLPFIKVPKAETILNRYSVNVIVNNADSEGAPFIFESNPTYYNLFGRIEHKFEYGLAVTDFSMIKAGSLHKANGGYLVIDALELLRNLFAYDALKRAIRNKEVRIEDIWEQYRLVTTTTLKPEAIPLNIKIILKGSQNLYYLLYSLDEDYRGLFKVKADFENRIPRDNSNVMKYSSFIATKCKEENLLPFDRTGVSRVVEYGSRLADHKEKLSMKLGVIADILRESHYWAKKEGKSSVSEESVEKALNKKYYRHKKIEDLMQEMMVEGTLIVDTSGEKVGQVNGLAVLDLGDYSFGKPSRITARTYTGKAGVVNIERETKMSGRIHEKAILIISNYLGSRYAIKKPVSLSASITFEQLYGLIEGDSATCAELYALLSSIAGVPIQQNIAITGSMDQNGVVQPIGGVNQKIEGFFDLCMARGLDGRHGVIIPELNVINLMLKRDLINAVKDGKFHVYTIQHIDDGFEILTGIQAGEMKDDGTYHEGTINYLVEKRLTEIRESLKEEKKEEEKKEEKKSFP